MLVSLWPSCHHMNSTPVACLYSCWERTSGMSSWCWKISVQLHMWIATTFWWTSFLADGLESSSSMSAIAFCTTSYTGCHNLLLDFICLADCLGSSSASAIDANLSECLGETLNFLIWAMLLYIAHPGMPAMTIIFVYCPVGCTSTSKIYLMLHHWHGRLAEWFQWWCRAPVQQALTTCGQFCISSFFQDNLHERSCLELLGVFITVTLHIYCWL